MEKEIASIWGKSFEQLPVCKDLPRLAGRITIDGQFTPVISPRRKDTFEYPSIRSFLQQYAKSNGEDAESMEQYAKALEREYYFCLDPSIRLIPTEKWQEYNIPDRIVDAIKKSAEEIKLQKRKSEQLIIEQMEERTISNFRLSSSINSEALRAIEAEDKIEDIITIETKKEKNVNKGIVREIYRVLSQLALRLEDVETQNRIKRKFDEILQKDSFGELQYLVEDVFQNTLSADSKVARVLKAIHQNIIFCGVFQLKSKVPSTGMTRDVRTKEGWRINVNFNNNVVSVSHRRREQALATAPEDEQYWFEWDLRMLFNKDLDRLESANLKITDLQFGEKISIRKKEEIKKALSGGNLIVS
eukprot:TRINITY_DN8099_c0_g1_i1.p1 TRINITY_DN8099_c0_g1~~TRINITY_DN8099_c0_g1_i1.p1  ORF type:complete len:383 (+),score=138.86 TRINITY_DN8099_c0_g1_i1:74-1150(+)